MLELLLCSMLTILPDYLFRRYGQGKRIGKEITLYSVWFELRWGIIGCLLLTVALITAIFYFHPSTQSVVAYFRAIPIVSETNGRVAQVYVKLSDEVKQGAPIFRLDDSKQAAELETARRRIIEVEAQITQGRSRNRGRSRTGRSGQKRAAASDRRTRDQARAQSPRRRYRRAARNRTA